MKSKWVAQNIGNYVETVICGDPKNFTQIWWYFFLIRVRLDVRKPIQKNMKITKEGGSWTWVDFKYGRLPTFFFLCGRLSHGDRFCKKVLDQGITTITKPFGPWLRVTPRSYANHHGANWLIEEDTEVGVDGADVSGVEEQQEAGIFGTHAENNPQKDKAWPTDTEARCGTIQRYGKGEYQA